MSGLQFIIEECQQLFDVGFIIIYMVPKEVQCLSEKQIDFSASKHVNFKWKQQYLLARIPHSS